MDRQQLEAHWRIQNIVEAVYDQLSVDRDTVKVAFSNTYM